MKKRIVVIGVIVIFIVVIALGAGIVGKKYMENKEMQDIKIQKQSAIAIKNEYADVQEIIFDKQGGYTSKTENDFGTWYADVKIKISNEWYSITTGKDGGSYGGIDKEFPEEKIGKRTILPVKVIYSNGDREVLK